MTNVNNSGDKVNMVTNENENTAGCGCKPRSGVESVNGGTDTKGGTKSACGPDSGCCGDVPGPLHSGDSDAFTATRFIHM